MIAMPGRSYSGPLDYTPEERELAARLRIHVESLAKKERNADLETPARYIASQMHQPEFQPFMSGGKSVRNVEAGAGPVVVGAHYDTVPGSPGADDNASGVAVLIELSRMGLPARFVAFAHEEMPFFQSDEMGSYVWASRARFRKDTVRAMLSLEMLGFYRDAPGTQQYPWPLSLFYPDRADFVAFVGDIGARGLVRQSISAFRAGAQFPSEGVAAPAFIPGVTWSDHWSFRAQGFPALMVTDTAFNRYPHYHLPTDTPDKLDYQRMAKVTMGLATVIRELGR